VTDILSHYSQQIHEFQVLFCDLHDPLLSQSQTISAPALRTNIDILLQLCRRFSLPFHFMTVPIQGKQGQLTPELSPYQTDENTHYRFVADPFLTPDFLPRLQTIRRNTLIIAGFSAEVGVLFTALSARQYGFRVLIPVDCMGSRSRRTEAVAIRQLELAGVEIISLATLAVFLQPDFSTENGKFGMTQMARIKS